MEHDMFTTGAADTALTGTGGVYKKAKSSVLGKARERERGRERLQGGAGEKERREEETHRMGLLARGEEGWFGLPCRCQKLALWYHATRLDFFTLHFLIAKI
jgi:hypothetical protein